MLCERGKLDLNDSLRKFFPELPYYGVTIRHLLTHTSGLPYLNFLNWIKTTKALRHNYLSSYITYSAYMLSQKKLLFTPGEKFYYSNPGYEFLALIVEKVSGQSFDSFIQENIFNPLKMNNTFRFTNEKDERCVNLDASLKFKKNKYKLLGFSNKNITMGDNNICTTVEDLFKFDQALYTEKLVSAKTLNEAFTSATLNNGNKTNYGYGWSINKGNYNYFSNADTCSVFHTGDYMTYSSLFARFLIKKNTIIYLSNIDPGFEFAYTNIAIDFILNK